MDFTFKGRPLTQDETKLFITMCLSKQKDTSLESDSLLSSEFLAKILIKRIKAYKLPFNISAMFFFVSINTAFTNPGKIMILLWLAYQYYKKNQVPFLSLNEWTAIFPFGVPTEEELQRMWESQKAPGAPMGNLLDDIRTWNPDPI